MSHVLPQIPFGDPRRQWPKLLYGPNGAEQRVANQQEYDAAVADGFSEHGKHPHEDDDHRQRYLKQHKKKPKD